MHPLDPLPPMHIAGLPDITFVAYSGWLPHSDTVNTRSTDSIEDDDLNYCPMPTPFKPFSQFTPSDIEQQLRLPGRGGLSGQLGHQPSGANAPGTPGGNSESEPPAKVPGAPHARRTPAAPERVRVTPHAVASDDAQRLIAGVGAFAAPMALWQSARNGRRLVRKTNCERNLGVSFTSAGSVRSVVFTLGFDPERVVVTSVQPGDDLPGTANVTLSCVASDGTAIARIIVTSNEEDLAAGTVNLASLLVRYLGDVSDDVVRLLSVDVNGDDAYGAEPVRLSIDGASSSSPDDEIEELALFQPGAASVDALANAIRISFDSLRPGTAHSTAANDEDTDARPAVRIAIGDVMSDEPVVSWPVPGRDELPNVDPQRRVDEAMAGGIRIPMALLAKSNARGPRVSIKSSV
jgi:hypothetical protein